jgi:hypothetical protein
MEGGRLQRQTRGTAALGRAAAEGRCVQLSNMGGGLRSQGIPRTQQPSRLALRHLPLGASASPQPLLPDQHPLPQRPLESFPPPPPSRLPAPTPNPPTASSSRPTSAPSRTSCSASPTACAACPATRRSAPRRASARLTARWGPERGGGAGGERGRGWRGRQRRGLPSLPGGLRGAPRPRRRLIASGAAACSRRRPAARRSPSAGAPSAAPSSSATPAPCCASRRRAFTTPSACQACAAAR